MAKKDIYKIDNYFITIGTIFLIIGLTIFLDPNTYMEVSIRKGDTYQYEDKHGRTLDQIKTEKGADEVTETTFPLIRSIILGNGIILLVIGIFYRRRENKIIAVWNALDRTGEAKVNDLAASLGLDRTFITNHLKDINAQQTSYYVWDQASDRIMDGKLMTEFLLVVECNNCGSKVNEKVAIDLISPPKCKYCGSPISSSESLNKLKQDVLTTHATVVASQAADKKEFNVVLFIVLMIFFWPGAIVYLIMKKSDMIKVKIGNLNPGQPVT
jgi:hypothetical protein